MDSFRCGLRWIILAGLGGLVGGGSPAPASRNGLTLPLTLSVTKARCTMPTGLESEVCPRCTVYTSQYNTGYFLSDTRPVPVLLAAIPFASLFSVCKSLNAQSNTQNTLLGLRASVPVIVVLHMPPATLINGGVLVCQAVHASKKSPASSRPLVALISTAT